MGPRGDKQNVLLNTIMQSDEIEQENDIRHVTPVVSSNSIKADSLSKISIILNILPCLGSKKKISSAQPKTP